MGRTAQNNSGPVYPERQRPFLRCFSAAGCCRARSGPRARSAFRMAFGVCAALGLCMALELCSAGISAAKAQLPTRQRQQPAQSQPANPGQQQPATPSESNPATTQAAVRDAGAAGSAATSDAGQANSGQAEPSGLLMAAAMEEAMIRAIAKAEKSVVSIARTSSAPDVEGVDMRADPFAPFVPIPSEIKPTDPAFVPHDFATGVIVDPAGLILTNFHVLAPGSRYWVRTVDRNTYEAVVVAGDKLSDLAVLRIKEAPQGKQFEPMTFGDAKRLRKGQIVIALGNPYAIARDGQASASWGIISNLARKAAGEPNQSEPTLHHLGTLIQTDAKLNLGTSGGALLNLQGEMIGLTTSLAAISGFEQAGGYAIPVDDLFLRALEKLKEGRAVEYGYLGVGPTNLPYKRHWEGLHGAMVTHVSQGTPARRGGMLMEDIVTHINGREIHDAEALRLQIGLLAPGTPVSLGLHRAGRHQTARVVLAKRPELSPADRIVTVESPDWRGLRVDYATAVLAREHLSDYLSATLAISSVAPDSPAARAGLRPRSLISQVGGTRVESPEEFAQEVAKAAGRPVTLHIEGGANLQGEIVVEAEATPEAANP